MEERRFISFALSSTSIILFPSYINTAFLFENKGIKLVKTLDIKSALSLFLKKLNLCMQLSYTLNKTKFFTEYGKLFISIFKSTFFC